MMTDEWAEQIGPSVFEENAASEEEEDEEDEDEMDDQEANEDEEVVSDYDQ